MKQNRKSRSRSNGGPSRSSGSRPAGNRSAKARTAKLRIVGGDMRGRIVLYHGADFTRPMKDNIRENLFNILGQSVRGSICFDLFSGTGAMAFESLSRGARSAVLVERDRRAVECIRKTADSLDVLSRMKILTGDAFQLAGRLLEAPEDDTPWIVFLCPPYVLWQDSLKELNQIIQTTINHAPPGSVLVAETERRFDPKLLPTGDWDLREYGGTRLAFIKPAMRCGMTL